MQPQPYVFTTNTNPNRVGYPNVLTVGSLMGAHVSCPWQERPENIGHPEYSTDIKMQ